MSRGSAYELSRRGTRSDYSDAIDALFARYDRPCQPGLALAVIEHGEVVHQRGYGVANVEDDVPIGLDTVFRLGSVSKHLCATCILLLEDRGRLNLDDDVRTYVPEVPDFGTPITLRHLLTMTSGLPDGAAMAIFAGMGRTLDVSRERHLTLVSRLQRPMYRPGDECLYSNSNYMLLSLLIERISGKTLRDFMREELFEPLGMASTVLIPDMAEVVPRKARGYVPGETGKMHTGLTLYEVSGDGGVDTTIADMVLWFGHYRRATVPVSGYRERMEAETRLNDGTVSPYRLGINVTRYRGLRKVSHPGGMAGYLADFAWYPEIDLGVIVLANWMDPALLERSDPIAEIVFDTRGELPPAGPAPESSPRPGLYVCHEHGYALAMREENGAAVCYLMGDRSQLQAGEGGSLEPSKRGSHYRVEPPADDGDSVRIRLGAEPELRFARVPEDPQPLPDPEAYAGRYRSDELGEVHEIKCGDGALEVALQSGLRRLSWRVLNYRGCDVFTAPVRAEPTESNLALRFERDAAGTVTGFRYSVYRCRDVLFRKVDTA